MNEQPRVPATVEPLGTTPSCDGGQCPSSFKPKQPFFLQEALVRHLMRASRKEIIQVWESRSTAIINLTTRLLDWCVQEMLKSLELEGERSPSPLSRSLSHRDPPVSASHVLELKACATARRSLSSSFSLSFSFLFSLVLSLLSCFSLCLLLFFSLSLFYSPSLSLFHFFSLVLSLSLLFSHGLSFSLSLLPSFSLSFFFSPSLFLLGFS